VELTGTVLVVADVVAGEVDVELDGERRRSRVRGLGGADGDDVLPIPWKRSYLVLQEARNVADAARQDLVRGGIRDRETRDDRREDAEAGGAAAGLVRVRVRARARAGSAVAVREARSKAAFCSSGGIGTL
jgi:hypothetical protein